MMSKIELGKGGGEVLGARENTSQEVGEVEIELTNEVIYLSDVESLTIKSDIREKSNDGS